MKQIIRLLGAAGVFSAFILSFGCGGGGGDSFFPVTVTESTPITSSQATNTGGSLVVLGQPLSAKAPQQVGQTGKVTAVVFPANATITPSTSFSAASLPVINVSIPVDNATTAAAGVPRITPPGGTAFSVASSKGAVDVSLSGTSTFTLSQPATVNIPVNAVLTNPVTVYSVKPNGTTAVLSGTYSLDANGNKIVTVSVSDFCTFVADPVPVTGSTGSTGGS